MILGNLFHAKTPSLHRIGRQRRKLELGENHGRGATHVIRGARLRRSGTPTACPETSSGQTRERGCRPGVARDETHSAPAGRTELTSSRGFKCWRSGETIRISIPRAPPGRGKPMHLKPRALPWAALPPRRWRGDDVIARDGDRSSDDLTDRVRRCSPLAPPSPNLRDIPENVSCAQK